MTTRHTSGLIVFTAAFVFTAVLLFSGQTVSSAGKGDRSAPSVPANLTVTGITDWTVSLKWQASTDNSGKFSYRVRINNLNNSAYNQLATVAQTQTTYTAKYLSSNSNYTFAVYAVDDNGNKSADSNLASAHTLADTNPPTGLVLQATVLTPSQVKLTWTTATDDVPTNCCNYGVNLNGVPITQNVNWLSQTSATIRHLQPGTGYSFSVTASDFSGGNATTSNAVDVVTLPSSDTLPPTVPTNLHLVRDDSCAEIWLGWTESSDASDSQANIEYEIYVNGVLSPLPVSAGVDFDFVYGTAFGDNYFTIRAVDRSGNSSAPSAPIKIFLWPC